MNFQFIKYIGITYNSWWSLHFFLLSFNKGFVWCKPLYTCMGSVTFVDTSGWLYMLFRQNRNSNHNSVLYITSSNFWLSSSYHHEGYFMPFNIKLWQCKNNFMICLITGYILASFPIGKNLEVKAFHDYRITF